MYNACNITPINVLFFNVCIIQFNLYNICKIKANAVVMQKNGLIRLTGNPGFVKKAAMADQAENNMRQSEDPSGIFFPTDLSFKIRDVFLCDMQYFKG